MKNNRKYIPLNIQKFSQEIETGTTIQINGSVTLNDVDASKSSKVLRLLGQTSQNGTPTPSSPIAVNVVSGDNEIVVTGKNLLNIDNWVKGRINNTTGNIEYASNVSSMVIGENNISFVVSQAWNSGIASDFIPISTGNYVFKYSHNREITMCIDTYDNEKSRISRIDAFTQTQTPTTRTFTISDSNVKYIRIHFEVNAANVECIVSEMQLEKGSTATTYEPYIGNSYPLYLGVENLFGSTMNITNRGVTIKKDSSNISLSGTGSSSGNINNTNNTFTLEAGTYTMAISYSSGTLTTNGASYVRLRNSSGDAVITGAEISLTSSNYNSGTKTATFTLDQTTTMYLSIYVVNGSAYNNLTYNAQIEKGTKINHASSTPIELCKIGDYQDYIYKDNGVWYLHKEIGKVVLDGSENNWSSVSSSSGYNRITFLDYPTLKNFGSSRTTNLYCNNFYVNIENNYSRIYQYEDDIYFSFPSGITTKAEFLQLLSTNNSIVYYVLATPTNTLIEDTTLIEQLESLSN